MSYKLQVYHLGRSYDDVSPLRDEFSTVLPMSSTESSILCLFLFCFYLLRYYVNIQFIKFFMSRISYFQSKRRMKFLSQMKKSPLPVMRIFVSKYRYDVHIDTHKHVLI